MTPEQEQDYRILRSCLEALHVDPDDDVCPDLEAIATGDGTVFQKFHRLRNELGDNVQAGRRAA